MEPTNEVKQEINSDKSAQNQSLNVSRENLPTPETSQPSNEDSLSELPTTSTEPEKKTNTDTSSQKVEEKVASLLQLIEKEFEEEKRRKESTLITSQSAFEIQKNFSKQLLHRVNVGVATTQKLFTYFQERSNMINSFAKSLKTLTSITESEETGTVAMGLDYLHRISTAEFENYQQYSQFLQDQTCKNLNGLLQELQNSFRKISSQITNFNKSVDSHADKVSKSFLNYESNLRETSQYISTQKELSKDPFLSKIQYYDSIKQLNLTQKEYASQLDSIFQEVEILDKKRISSLKTIIIESITTQKNCNLKILKDMDIARDTVQTMNGNDWNQFCITLGLPNHPTSEPLVKRFHELTPKKFIDGSFINVFKTMSVLRVGELELSGMLKWSKYSFILTKFGFLHYFSPGQGLEPFGTIALCYCTLDLTQPQKNLFNIISSPPGFFSSTKTYSFRCSNEETMVDWVIALKKFVKK